VQAIDAIRGNVDNVAKFGQATMDVGGGFFFVLDNEQTHQVTPLQQRGNPMSLDSEGVWRLTAS
jgi:hypothetical protein